MIKKIKFTADFDSEFVFEIDTEKFTEELAKEINDFWMDTDWRLMKFDNDVRLAALSMYAASLFTIVVEYEPTVSGVAYYFNREQLEGYMPLHDEKKEKTHRGIKLIGYNVTVPEATDFEAEVEELTEKEGAE